MDTLTKERRSALMRSIKGINTNPELVARKSLHKLGYRFGLHNKKLPGTPDLVLRKYKTVIFVNGCFWHGHEGCSKSSLPKTKIDFWKNKIDRNKERDAENIKKLTKLGWRAIEIFQCELKNSRIDGTMAKVIEELKASNH